MLGDSRVPVKVSKRGWGAEARWKGLREGNTTSIWRFDGIGLQLESAGHCQFSSRE